MRRVATVLMLITALSLVVGFLMVSGCGDEPVEESAPVVRPVKTMVVGGATAGVRTYPGRVQAAQRVNLSFRVGGPLIEFPVNEGDKVKKGQLLARIDPRDYQIALDQARAEFIKSEADLERYQQLYEKEAVPLSDLDLRKSLRDVAKARLDDAQADLNDTYLRAPFSGEVGEKVVNNRQDVHAKQAILSLHDVSGVEVVVDVPEADRARFGPEDLEGARLYATLDFAAGREFSLTLTEFSSSADPLTQTYKATLAMERPEGVNIQPGMTVTVTVEIAVASTGEEVTEFTVPSAAVFAGDDGSQYVWVVNPADMTLQQRAVTVGEVTGTGSINVLSGLSAGDMIATAGVNQLREGMKIRPMQ